MRPGRANNYSYVTNATYYPGGGIDSFNYGNGFSHKTELNSRNVPERIKDYSQTLTAVEFSYLYDDNLNITSLTDAVNSNYSLTDLRYDGLNRLIGTTGNSAIGSSAITYDGLGNIEEYTSKERSLTYSYNRTNNRLTSVTGISGKYGSIQYDDRGNIQNNGSRGFTFNRANQLVESQANQYWYDGHNRRVKQTDAKGTSYSVYSMDGTLLYRETEEGGVNYIYLGKKLVAKDGVVKPANEKQSYRPFGESISEPVDDVGYTGHKFDTDLGLSYMQARYYDPVIGRFYSNDPVGAIGHLSQGNIQGFNRYAYANNNPYKYVDPDGEFAVCTAGPVGVIACVGAFSIGVAAGKFGNSALEASEIDNRLTELKAFRAQAINICLRSGKCKLADKIDRQIEELKKQQRRKLNEVAENGCLVGTACGGGYPTSTVELAIGEIINRILDWFEDDDDSEDPDPEVPEDEK